MAHIDLEPSILHEIPQDLCSALNEHPETAEIWNSSISPIARNEWICWIEDAKQPATREKRIRRMYENLANGKKRPCCWPGCSHRTDKPTATRTIVSAKA